jgi:uncharacterized membrane protein YidH (DUF202 family)
VWLLGIWILCLFNHPGFIIAFGVIYAAAAGLRFSGLETVEGSSEFVFALPPTRQQRCLVSLTIGLASVIAMTLLGDLALAFNLPQVFWEIFVSSGFTAPYEPTETNILHWHAVLIPTAVFAGVYAMASFAKARSSAMASPLIGLIAVGMIVGLSHHLEFIRWQQANGIVAIPLLCVFSVLVLILAYRFCLVKEQISQPNQRQGMSEWLVLIIAVVVALLFLLLILSLMTLG